MPKDDGDGGKRDGGEEKIIGPTENRRGRGQNIL